MFSTSSWYIHISTHQKNLPCSTEAADPNSVICQDPWNDSLRTGASQQFNIVLAELLNNNKSKQET